MLHDSNAQFSIFRSAIGSGISAFVIRRISSKLKKRPTCTLPKLPPRQPEGVGLGVHPRPGAGRPSPQGAAVAGAGEPRGAMAGLPASEGSKTVTHGSCQPRDNNNI